MRTRFDIPNGLLSAGVSISGDGFGLPRVTVQDDFTLSGLPAGTPIMLVAHLGVSISANRLGYPRGAATMSDAFGHSVSAFLPGETELTVDVPAVAGQPFLLRFEVSAQGDYEGGGSASGAISFSNVPPGAVVRSCNGYTTAGTVAVRRAIGHA